MTPSERAEKIFRDACYGHSDLILRGNAPEVVERISEQIREAEKEAQHCCFAEDSPCNQKHLAIWNIRASALEEAAKVAANLDPKDIETNWITYRSLVVRRIRALAERKD